MDIVIVAPALGVLIGLFFLWKGSSYHSKAEQVEVTKTTKIDDLEDGFAEVKGEAEVLKEKIYAPFSGTACVYCRYKVEEMLENLTWREIKSGVNSVEFNIRDDTGKIHVKPAGAEMLIDESFMDSIGLDKEPNEKIREFLIGNKIGYTTPKGVRHLRFKESHITPGESVYVIGSHKQGKMEKGKEWFYISDYSEHKVHEFLLQYSRKNIIIGALFLSFSIIFVLGYFMAQI